MDKDLLIMAMPIQQQPGHNQQIRIEDKKHFIQKRV